MLIAIIGLIFITISLKFNSVTKNAKKNDKKNRRLHSIGFGIAVLGLVCLAVANFGTLMMIHWCIFIIGALCNWIAVAFNGGRMPFYDRDILHLSRKYQHLKDKVDIDKKISKFHVTSNHHCYMTETTRVKILCDWIPCKKGMASIGDYIINTGFWVMIAMLAFTTIRALYQIWN